MSSLGDPAFASTGPQGHRGRMRERLLSRGPDGLADYEMLEMLLFLSIPRRDTKPLAKALINQFGSLHRTIAAPTDDLRRAKLDTSTARVFEIVAESARRLSRAEAISRPLLNDMASLIEYLDLAARLRRPSHLAVLLLNNRNQLLAEMVCTDGQAPPDIARSVVRRAVQIYATAFILVTCRPDIRPDLSEIDIEITRSVSQCARGLSILVHDHLVLGTGQPMSLKQMGLL